MSALLIDERGKLWDPRSVALRALLRASIEDRELREFAIVNLGFVGVVIAKTSVHIKLRPALVRPAALGALYLCLHQVAPERVVVSWYNGSWQHEIIGWSRDGWRRITRLLEVPEIRTREFSRGKISLDRLAPKNPLRTLIEDAPRLASIVANPAQMLPPPLNDRYILVTEDCRRELRVSDFGCTMMSRSPRWRSQARGRRIEDQPDWNYGQWVADAYRDACYRGEPLLEEVAAVIEWPELGTFSHAYWRLIVPRIEPGLPTRILGVTMDKGGVGVDRVS
jgi:hypothetical protein